MNHNPIVTQAERSSGNIAALVVCLSDLGLTIPRIAIRTRNPKKKKAGTVLAAVCL